MSITGSCHCGTVTFTVDAEPPTRAMSCNCSICRRKALLFAFFPAGQVSVTGEDGLAAYMFNKHRIAHRFCTTCGVEPFATGAGPDGVEMRAINLRCVPDLDLDALEIQRVDGASL
jgi:hypothetical protein